MIDEVKYKFLMNFSIIYIGSKETSLYIVVNQLLIPLLWAEIIDFPNSSYQKLARTVQQQIRSHNFIILMETSPWPCALLGGINKKLLPCLVEFCC